MTSAGDPAKQDIQRHDDAVTSTLAGSILRIHGHGAREDVSSNKDTNPDSERKDGMLTQTTISDGRTVTLDLEPMSLDQQKQLVAAIADFLVRSGQIVPDVALSAPHLLQFLSEAADMAQDQSTPVDPEDVTVFGVGALETHVTVPDDLLTKREIDGTFDEGCSAIRVVNDAAIENPDLAYATATLLNRAYWLGQGRCAPFHVEPRS